eukprot:COSAG01_NODE_6525_length_3623_cov_4.488082_4_plen_61_part_01
MAEGYRTVGTEHWRPTMAAARAQGQQEGHTPARLLLAGAAAAMHGDCWPLRGRRRRPPRAA